MGVVVFCCFWAWLCCVRGWLRWCRAWWRAGSCDLPVMLLGGAVEARRSRVARKWHRVSDAEGALDLGGAAPEAARHHRSHPRTQHPIVLDAGAAGRRLLRVEKGVGCAPGGLSWWGRVACSRSVSRGVDRPVGAVGHPFAARGGMECCDRCGRTGSIKRDDSPGGGGHDRHDPRRPRWGYRLMRRCGSVGGCARRAARRRPVR